MNQRITAILVLLLAIGAGWYAQSPAHPFVQGLDLASGAHLTYRADTAGVEGREIDERMLSLKEVIERRVNIFGVSEPIVQVETGRGENGDDEHRIIVELPGVTDVSEAVAQIGRTPQLEFKLGVLATTTPVKPAVPTLATTSTSTANNSELTFIASGLSGKDIINSQLQFNGGAASNEAGVLVTFSDEGKAKLAEVTGANVGNVMAIFLDGEPISTPVIREAITDGKAVISGAFTPQEARDLNRDLNFGALPFSVELIGSQSIGPSLGADTWARSIKALGFGILAISLYLIAWYRRNGIIAAVSLAIYAAIVLTLFKLIPVTLTAAGIAGFILSLGMAVDANVLIFERIRDERKKGVSPKEAIEQGFSRAWPSIRDGNLTSLISSVILYWFSGTPLVKGFALVFIIGILASMFTAITVSRIFMRALPPERA